MEPIRTLSALLMRGGKKRLVAKRLLVGLRASGWKNTCALTGAIYRLRPILETRKVRRGAKYYDVPFYLSRKRSTSLVYRWLARSFKVKPKASLEYEWTEIIMGRGFATKEAELLRQRISANMRYSHYRWK